MLPINSDSSSQVRSERAWLIGIVLIAVFLRLIFLLVIEPQPERTGGDSYWYFQYGSLLIRDNSPPLATGPTFLVYAGIVKLFFAEIAEAILAARFLNIIWHVILVASVFSLGGRYFNNVIARLAGLIIAVSPVFIIETGVALSESLYMALLFGALAIYAAYQDCPTVRIMLIIGVLLGIAALTRAVLLLFPLVLFVQLIYLHGWRKSLKFSAILLVTYALTVSTWTVYNLYKWNRFVVGAEGFQGFLWMGAFGQQGPQETDTNLGLNEQASVETEDRNQLFLQQFFDKLRNELPNYIATRMSNLVSSYLQPHNTTHFSIESLKDGGSQWLMTDRSLYGITRLSQNESLKDEAAEWFSTDRSLSGLIRLTQGDHFWSKLLLYIAHFPMLIFGFLGLLINWRRFWILAPIYGYFLYTNLAHSLLLASPRYLFPMMPVLVIFGASALWALSHAFTTWREKQRFAHAA